MIFFYQNTKLFIHENASDNIVCGMAAILARRRWVKTANNINTCTFIPGDFNCIGLDGGYAVIVWVLSWCRATQSFGYLYKCDDWDKCKAVSMHWLWIQLNLNYHQHISTKHNHVTVWSLVTVAFIPMFAIEQTVNPIRYALPKYIPTEN